MKHHVCHQPLVPRLILTRDHTHQPNLSQRQQRRLDASQLDAEATNLHLRVDTPEKLDVPIRRPTNQVTRLVHQCTLLTAERIRHQLLLRQLRRPEVPTEQLHTSQVQLSVHSHRHRLQTLIQHIHLSVHHRRPNRRRCQQTLRHLTHRRVHRVLRRTIDVHKLVRHTHSRTTMQLVTTRVQHTQLQVSRPRLLLQHSLRQLRRQERNLDLLVRHPLQQVARNHPNLVIHTRIQTSTTRQTRPRLRHGCVECQPRVVQHPVTSHHLVVRNMPTHVVHQRMVLQHHALRTTCRPRRVDGVRHIRWRVDACRVVTARRCKTATIHVHADHLPTKVTRHAIRQRCLRQDHTRLRVTKHHRQPLRRVLGIQRHHRPTTLQRRVPTHHQIHRTMQKHRHQRLALDAQETQVVRQPVRSSVQLGVRHHLIADHDCRGVRCARNLLFHKLVHTRIRTSRASGVIPLLDH